MKSVIHWKKLAKQRDVFLQKCSIDDINSEIEKTQRHFNSLLQENVILWQNHNEKAVRRATLDVEIARLKTEVENIERQGKQMLENRGWISKLADELSWNPWPPEYHQLLQKRYDLTSLIVDIERSRPYCINPRNSNQDLLAMQDRAIRKLNRLKEKKIVEQGKKQEKQEKLTHLKAVAASAMGRTRDFAVAMRPQIKKSQHCPYCDILLQAEDCHLDHIYPVSKGGHSTIENMVFVCVRCNQKKKHMTLNQFIGKFHLNRDRILAKLQELDKAY